jgi:hypothetical protein
MGTTQVVVRVPDIGQLGLRAKGKLKEILAVGGLTVETRGIADVPEKLLSKPLQI